MSIDKELADFIEKEFRCYLCNTPTDRYIKFNTASGVIYDFECLDCRQKRVQEQVNAGLRPASDLDVLPEEKYFER